MKKIIIKLPYNEVLKRKRRWEKAISFQLPDRVPCIQYIGARYWLPLIGFESRFNDYINAPHLMLECQLLGQKWILDNVQSDFHKIVCYPDFMWVEDVESFGAKIVFPPNDSPWVARPHLLQTDEDLETIKGVDWVHDGLHGKMLSYYGQMREAAADYEIVFDDGMVIPAVDTVYPGGGGIIGIAGLAGDLCGVEKFSTALFDKPAWVKELLGIIVQKAIDWIDVVATLNEGKVAFCSDFNERFIHVGDDGTAQMSPAQIQEFMLLPHLRLAEHIRKIGFKVQAHNCGKADHLLDFWKDQVQIERYIGFSYLTNKRALRAKMGGKVLLMGGINTVKLHDGSPQDVMEDCRLNLDIFKDCPGFVMMDGHNIAPGTPLENINAMKAAAEEYGQL